MNDPFHLFLNALCTTLLIVGAQLLTKLGVWLKSKPDPTAMDVVREAGHIGDRIIVKLAELGTRIHAQRCHLCQYHNGQRYVSGSKLVKQSMTHEWTADNFRGVARQHQDTLITWVPEECKLVEENGPSFRFTKDLPVGTFRRILEAEGVCAIARCAVYYHGEVVGFIGVDFLECPETIPARISELPVFAARIERELSEESRGSRHEKPAV